jgi:hypothetical protein
LTAQVAASDQELLIIVSGHVKRAKQCEFENNLEVEEDKRKTGKVCLLRLKA